MVTRMTGLLNKIRTEHASVAIQKQPAQIGNRVDDDRVDGVTGPAEPAMPCADCRCPTFWRSAYGGPLRCAVCEPWPSLAMVGERWTLYCGPGGVLEWVPALRKGERATTRQDASQGPQNERDGITWQNLDDEEGSWVAVSKVLKAR